MIEMEVESMARRKKYFDIPGQMSFCFSVNSENYVVEHNDLVNGHQSLSLQAAKVIRTCIMQIRPDDKELHPYVISLNQLAGILNASKPSLVRDMDRICEELTTHPVTVKEYDEKTKKVKCIRIPWVSLCAYSSGSGLAIKLNDELRPLLVQLSRNYVQFVLADVLTMKSVYAVRIYEMLLSRIQDRILPRDGVEIEIPVADLRRATNTEDKFERISNFKEKVIERAEAEILRTTSYKVTHRDGKTGKRVTSLFFNVTMQYY